MKRSDENIAKLTKENIEKDLEIIRKERILNILKQKAKRIEKQRYAVQKYEHFLEEVRVKNSD
jgi:predicted ribosome quality control (RQC) complex YloA/Tae2 family protein